MRAARELGVTFLDDARYNDETGAAPLKSGYSEVVFGELFRASGWVRDKVVLANKLWWEFWPRENAEMELDGSLQRMAMDHVDLIYAERPPAGLEIEELVGQVGGLIATGKARAWGVLNWPATLITQAAEATAHQGVAAPCAAQLAYSLVQRSPVEDEDMLAALRSCGAGVVASYVMAGGVLTGKYSQQDTAGRMADRLSDRGLEPALESGKEVKALAERTGTAPGALAIAFGLLNPNVTSVLFGATSPKQVAENARALDCVRDMDQDLVNQLRQIGR
jgi:aryl-alcohol dehydrogenase-like predicted oxidoreductase